MKRHEQLTGVRKWSGNDLVELQSEALKVLDGFFSQYGDVVVQGCCVSGSTIASGLVNIGGRVMPFEGATGITNFPIYLEPSVSSEQREYVDGVVKDIAKIYVATTTQIKPTADYIEIPEDGKFVRFFDMVESTWLVELKSRLTAVEAYDVTVANTLASLVEAKEDHEDRILQLESTPVYAVPTLSSVPSASTTTYVKDGDTFNFVIGQQCRVYNSTSGRYQFYQLYSLVNDIAVWQIINSCGYTTSETLRVNLCSNQSSYDESLLGVTVSITYSGESFTATWSGTPLTFIVPQESMYNVSVSDLTNYSSPSSQSFTAAGGKVRDIFMLYSCERVVVSLSSDGDATMTAQGVTIKNTSTGLTIGSGTGEQVIVKVPTGISYTITVSDLDEYATPETNTYTATMIERNVDMTYMKWLSATIVFDTSISDAENISGDINSGVLATILAKFRRCLCKRTADGMVSICYLKSTDSTKYEDGTTAILTGAEGDVMVDFPEFYYKRTTINSTQFSYSFSEYNIDGTYIHVPRSLVGAYKGEVVDNRLYSRSGIYPACDLTYLEFNTCASNRGIGFQQIDFQQHCVIAFMLYAKYGTRALRSILGSGYSTAYSSTTGTTNATGNADTIQHNVEEEYICGLGLEGVFGGVYEWVSGVSIEDHVWDITDPDGTVRSVMACSSSGWIKQVAAEKGLHFDMVPTAVGGSGTTYYADNYYRDSGGPLCLQRAGNGVAYMDAYANENAYDYMIGSRLAFRGIIEETASVTAFKSIEI